MVDELGLSREQVVFEIVEGERLPDLRFLGRIVEYYRTHGFEVALDDTGAGYASLNVLLALRPTYVKLDRGLLHEVQMDADRAVVARKLIETAHELGLQTIAEGIETWEELAWVTTQGVQFAQGYLFARPATPPPMRDDAA